MKTYPVIRHLAFAFDFELIELVFDFLPITKLFHTQHLLRDDELPNGLRYLRVGGCGFCLGAGKTRSQKST